MISIKKKVKNGKFELQNAGKIKFEDKMIYGSVLQRVPLRVSIWVSLQVAVEGLGVERRHTAATCLVRRHHGLRGGSCKRAVAALIDELVAALCGRVVPSHATASTANG